nr:MAG TPA: hypothetical protein [Caudoviricetes sp.]
MVARQRCFTRASATKDLLQLLLEVILRAKALRSNFYSKAPAGDHSSQKSVTDSVTDSMSNQK